MTHIRCLMTAIAVTCILPWTASPVSAAQNDTKISDAIEDEYLFDRIIPINDIDVETIDGIVTLNGRTPNILAKERATAIAETVRGVRSVINLIKVQPTTQITAKELTEDINSALALDPATDSWEITVNASQNGVVTLEGTVQSWQEKQLSSTVAKGVNGVTELNNQIDIEFKKARPDFELRHEITSRLDWDVLIDSPVIKVSVTNGKVELSGTVGSAAEKRRAERQSWVAGVKDVNADKLKVRDWADDTDTRDRAFVHRTDEQISSAIKDSIVYDPRVFSGNVTPTSLNGWVTLRGVVDNALAKEAAETVARHTTGVHGVNNRLKVRSESTVNDRDLEDNIELKLSMDPWVNESEIKTGVESGTAYLRGNVDTWFEKTRAETLAHGVNGVRGVENRLAVEDSESMLLYNPYIWSLHPHPWRYYPYTPGSVTFHTRTTNRNIEENIENELFWSPFVDSDEVDVQVTAGVATLTGDVDSRREREAATENAWEGGATAVINKLTIRKDNS